jgi:LmbE family N-acetylglucosaminyl deacetylase
MPCTNILFVVCHPDDEALWVGGLLHGLSRFPAVAAHVICLSGADENSPRKAEFEAAKVLAGYRSGVVLGGGLRSAGQPLPQISDTIISGLKKLGLSIPDIDILITHSPYGEEHMHPHHIQACEELYDWSKDHGISFGFFSCLPLPSCHLKPMLRNMKRFGNLQALNYAYCKYGLFRRLIRLCERRPWRYPYLYTQWLVDSSVKTDMLNCYRSIDLHKHKQGYAMFGNNVESIYLFDRNGADFFHRILRMMDVPGSQDYFTGTWTDEGFMRRVLKIICFWRS